MSAGKCVTCSKPSTQTCDGCHSRNYCSWEHQTADWETHIANCRPFKVERNDWLGRHFVATRDIAVGEVVLKERPLMSGPSRSDTAVCVVCYRRLLQGHQLTSCGKCGWPVCSTECTDSETHRPECELVSARAHQLKTEDLRTSHPIYRCLTVLRCLRQKTMDTKTWEKIMRLEAHSDWRKKSGAYETDRVELVNCLQQLFQDMEDYCEEEILQVCGIVQINSFVNHLTEPPHLTIYNSASYIEHNCLANCSKTFAADGELLLRAAVAIAKKDHLSICYTDQTWGTARRRYMLAQEQLACRCTRCKDPTEMGTFYSAVCCPSSHCDGYLLPENPLADASVTDEDFSYSGRTSWRCDKCAAVMKASEVTAFLKQVERDVKSVDSPEECEMLLSQFDSKVLHGNHYYLTELRIKLVVTYGRDNEGGLQELSGVLLDRKIELCRQVLMLADKLFPAETRARGLVMFELHESLAEQMSRKASEGSVNTLQLTTNIQECTKMLQGAEKLLSSEPTELPEGEVAVEAKRRILDLEQCAYKESGKTSSLDALHAIVYTSTKAQLM